MTKKYLKCSSFEFKKTSNIDFWNLRVFRKEKTPSWFFSMFLVTFHNVETNVWFEWLLPSLSLKLVDLGFCFWYHYSYWNYLLRICTICDKIFRPVCWIRIRIYIISPDPYYDMDLIIDPESRKLKKIIGKSNVVFWKKI